MALTDAPSAKDIKTGFTYQRFDPIRGEPSYKTIHNLEKQATRNAATVAIRLNPPHIDLSGIVKQPAVYVLCTGGPFPRPGWPGRLPVFPDGTSAENRANQENAYNEVLKNYLLCERTETILKTMVENTIEEEYLSGIHSETLGFGNRSLRDIFAHLYRAYGRISPMHLQANTARLSTPVPSHLPIVIIFKQIEDFQHFVTAGGTLFAPAQLLNAAETLILATGKYQLAYREWVGLPAAQKTFQNFRVRFTAEYQVLNEVNQSTAAQGGYAANVVENHQDDEALQEAIDNFVQASAADRNAFLQLTVTNSTLQAQNSALQNQITDLQQQVQMINLTQGQQPPIQHRSPPARAPPRSPPAY